MLRTVKEQGKGEPDSRLPRERERENQKSPNELSKEAKALGKLRHKCNGVKGRDHKPHTP